MRFLRYLEVIVLLFGVFTLSAQDPNRFKNEIDELIQKEYQFESGKKIAVFTGSSSVKMWKDVAEYFPEFNVINNGFGGSHFSDLIYFYEELIPEYNPDYLFIYEGDNDIADEEKPREIYKEAKLLVGMIQEDLPHTKVVLISAKPSVARWLYSKKYNRLNRKLERLCRKTDNLEFADVWSPMLDENGQVFTDVFLDDNLHMNKKGYDIWGEVLLQYFE
ncbi:Lysophospholipase L1 [Tangfeifania diversioriginum]|uniref:Lysophospholipase L1 n=1 Tax=Tangfeifania diversioriginum TaxID=1168035 RepID=A0A1M6GIB0_9BACT|nr:GDSL-type esterase/lipase family protein [Tangfeifania diversioriginum]SHJ09653.1 Lysophospholipase L1 [Tangfeifania diversioriginum]